MYCNGQVFYLSDVTFGLRRTSNQGVLLLATLRYLVLVDRRNGLIIYCDANLKKKKSENFQNIFLTFFYKKIALDRIQYGFCSHKNRVR